jgi:hypothetical protein
MAAAPARMSVGQSHYLESCGGCHGIQGASAEREIPQLRGLVGRFLYTPQGREYLVRLPNVAFANVDDKVLADVLNFVVFQLGEGSAPREAPAYTAAEVKILRRQPFKNERLEMLRAKILAAATIRANDANEKRQP